MSLKKIQAREKYLKEQKQREDCRTLAIEKFGEEEFMKIKQANNGLYFLPVVNNEGEIQKLALIKPINPHIHKICELAYIRCAMRECFIGGDKEILEDDKYTESAAETFMKILQGKNLKC